MSSSTDISSLVQRLRSAPADALALLLTLVSTSPQHQLTALDAGAIDALVPLLTQDDLVTPALRVLVVLVADNAAAQAAAVQAGAVAHVTKLLDKDRFQRDALHVFSQLVHGSDAARAAAVDAGAMQRLVGVLDGSPDARTKRLAMLTLRLVADGHPEYQRAALVAGAIAVLVKTVKDCERGMASAADAALTLAYIVDGREDAQTEALAHGACAALVHLLHRGTGDGRVNAAKALRCLVKDNAKTQQVATDALPILTQLLDLGTTVEKIEASHAIAFLIMNNVAAQNLATSVGTVRLLVEMFDSSSQHERTVTAAAVELGNLVLNNRRHADTYVDAASIGGLIDFLRSEVQTPETEAGLALAHLVENNPEAQEQAVNAGAVPRLHDRIRVAAGREIANDTLALANLIQGDKTADTILQQIIEDDVLFRLVEIVRDDAEDAKRNALRVLKPLVTSDNYLRTVLVKRRIVEPVVGLLQSRGSCFVAAAFLYVLLHQHPEAIEAAREAGAVIALVRVLSDGPKEVITEAAWNLGYLTVDNEPAQTAVVERDGVAPLVRLLGNKTADDTCAAAYALACLAFNNPRSRDAVIEANAVVAMLGAICSDVEVDKSPHINALATLINSCPIGQAKALEADAVPVLVRLLKTGSEKEKDASALAIGRLAQANPAAQGAVIAEPNAISTLVEVISDESPSLRYNALFALQHLVHRNTAAQEVCIETGALAAAIHVARVGEMDLMDMTFFILQVLAQHPKMRGLAIETEAVVGLVELLGSSNNVTIISGASQTLAYLMTDNPKAKKQALASGALRYLVAHSGNSSALNAITQLIREFREAQNELVDAGVIPLLLEQVRHDDGGIRANTLELLGAMVSSNVAAQGPILAAGGLGILLQVLRHAPHKEKRLAVTVLANLLKENAAAHAEEALAAGAVGLLVDMIGADTKFEIPSAAQIVHFLAVAAPRVVKHLVDAKLVDRVVRCLCAEDCEGKLNGLHVLYWLTKEIRELCDIAVEAGAINWLVQAVEKEVGDVKTMSLSCIWVLVVYCDTAYLNTIRQQLIQLLLSVIHVTTGDVGVFAASALVSVFTRCDADAISEALCLEVVDMVLEVICKLDDHETQLGFKTGMLVFVLVVNNRRAREKVLQTGVLTRFIDLIRTGTIATKLASAMAVTGLATKHLESQKQLVEGRAVPVLIELLQEYHGLEVMAVANALGTIMEYNYAHQMLVLDGGAIPILVKLLTNEDEDIATSAGCALISLVHKNSAASAAVMDTGAFEMIVERFKTSSEQNKVFFAATLLVFTRASPDKRSPMLVEESLATLAKALHVEDDDDSKGDIMEVLRDFAEDERSYQDAVVGAGVMEPLVAVMRSSRRDTRTKAIIALRILIDANEAAQAAAVAAGAVECLIATISVGGDAIRSAEAARTLALLADGRPPVNSLVREGGLHSLRETAGGRFLSTVQST